MERPLLANRNVGLFVYPLCPRWAGFRFDNRRSLGNQIRPDVFVRAADFFHHAAGKLVTETC